MAAEKQKKTPKKQQKPKATSTPTTKPTLRRSTRITKAEPKKSRVGSPEQLLEAVKLLSQGKNGSREKSPAKSVSFSHVPLDHGRTVDFYSQFAGTDQDDMSQHVPMIKEELQAGLQLGTRAEHRKAMLQSHLEQLGDNKSLMFEYDDDNDGSDHKNLLADDGYYFQIDEDPEIKIARAFACLRSEPRPLSLMEIAGMFQILQNRIFGSHDGEVEGFAAKHFSFTLTQWQCKAWPLHELKTTYVPLYMTTRLLADGSQYGWPNFFTQPETRQYLVAAVLGEWFTQRIFKHTAFGFPAGMLEKLMDKDREYLHYDAIVRSKERAQLMKSWFSRRPDATTILDATSAEAEELAEELLTVLHPLLPPPLFDPLGSPSSAVISVNGMRDSVFSRKLLQARDLRGTIKNDLLNLILDCAALHQGIRLTGGDGTIIRMCPSIQKGSKFHPNAPVDCVNKSRCNDTCPLDPKESSELCVKMNCFPRVEAIVPRGPDMKELFQTEQSLRRQAAAAAAPAKTNGTHRRGRSARSMSQTVTGKQSKDANADDDVDDDDDSSTTSSEDSFSWDDHDALWPIVPPRLQDNEGRNPGVLNPETGEINTIKRASYVKLYHSLTPSKVYCEWTPQPAQKGETLDEAIRIARNTHPEKKLALKIEDWSIEAWNAWALYGGLAQWGLLTTAAVVGFCRAFSIPSHVQTLLLKLLTVASAAAKRVTTTAASIVTTNSTINTTTAIAVAAADVGEAAEQLPNTAIFEISRAMHEVVEALKPWGEAVTNPIKKLIVDPIAQTFGLEVIPDSTSLLSSSYSSSAAAAALSLSTAAFLLTTSTVSISVPVTDVKTVVDPSAPVYRDPESMYESFTQSVKSEMGTK